MKHRYLKFSPLLVTAALLGVVPEAAFAEAFDGPYAGVEAGIGILKSKGSTIAGPFKKSEDSAVASVILGYRTTLGADSPIMVGAEGSLGIHSNGSNARYGVSGIGGVRIAENGLAYVRAGYGWLDGIQTGAGSGIDGLVLGGGAEIRLSERMSARADYKYFDYGGVNFPDNTIDFKGHEIVASILFNF